MLAPAAAGLGRGLERVDELAGLRAGVGLHQHQRLHLLGEAAIGRGTRLFDLGEALLIFLKVGVDRFEQRGDLLLALFERRGRAVAVLGENLVGQLQKRFLAAVEGIGGEPLDGLLELAAQGGQRRDALVMRGALGGGQRRGAFALGGKFPPAQPPRDPRPNGEPNEQHQGAEYGFHPRPPQNTIDGRAKTGTDTSCCCYSACRGVLRDAPGGRSSDD